MMLDVKSAIIVGVIAFFIGVFGAWWLTASYMSSKHDAEIQAHNAQSAQALAKSQEQVAIINEQREAIATESEVKFAKQQKDLDAIRDINRKLLSGGVLPDKTNSSGKALSIPPSAKPSFAASTTTELPTEIAKELIEISREADTAASYATSCYEWIKSVK